MTTRSTALALCLLPALHAAATCEGYGDLKNNTDIAGTMVATPSAPSPDACCMLCDKTFGCEAFSWFAGVCYLKGDLQETYTNAGRYARVKSQPKSNCSTYSAPLKDTDISGDMLKEADSLTADGCCSICSATAGCQGFSFFAQKCYIKGHVNGTYHNDGRLTRTRKETSPTATSVVV